MDNGLKTKILYEISQIDKLISDAKPLFDLCKAKKPEFIEISAASMVMHSFYNGIENILTLIIKHYEGQLPNNSKWHMDLLDKAFISDTNGKQIFSNKLQEPMEEYLKFRHFVRHAYGFQLDWERMENLVNGLYVFWDSVKENLNSFLNLS